MDIVDKISLLKDLELCSCLLKKHQALKKEKELKSVVTQQTRTSLQPNKSESFQNYSVMKNHSNPLSCFNKKYSFKKPSHFGCVDQNKGNGLYNQRQNFNSKYCLSKNKVINNFSRVNNLVASSRNVNDHSSLVNTKSICNSKNKSINVPCVSSNKSGKLTIDRKDFMKEVESLTELLKKKTSGSACKILNSASKCEKVAQNKQSSCNKDQNNVIANVNFLKKGTAFSKSKDLVKIPSKMPANINYANRKNCITNSNSKNNHQIAIDLHKSVYKKDNVKQASTKYIAASLKNVKYINESNDGFKNPIPSSTSRKVILSHSKNLSHHLCTSGIFPTRPLSSGIQESVMKLHMPNKIISSTRRVLKKSPYVSKIKSPILLNGKYFNTIKISKSAKQKQTNSRYTKINKHLTPPNKKVQLRYSTQNKSLKKIKKKVNSKYKVINKTQTPSSNKKTANSLCISVDKNKSSLSMNCDSLLNVLNDSAVEKLEKNLLVISSELTAPLSSKKNEVCDNKVNQPLLAKVSCKTDNKRVLFKKSKSRISKYKIINSNVSSKYSVKNLQSVHMVTPLRERAVLVRRLYKSKNVIINKNASPTSYSAKMIKSKYLSLNKRKSSTWQKYVYPTMPQHMKFKGPYFATRLHLKQKRLKNVSMYHSQLIRKRSYKRQNCRRQRKNINNRYTHSPVIFIRGARYSRNLNGKTLRKLPTKGHTSKYFQRTKLVMRTSENVFKVSPASANLASRVLHRSINRILTASSKKKLSKVNTYCMFYNRFGRCNRGVKCTFIHDPSKIAVCTRFLRGTCKIDRCPFSHEVDPGKMAICSFFLVGQCVKENCLYRHEKLSPNAVLCKDFVQGYCHHGKECKKAHILICPKYMQGECDKGSSCAFPHPPNKAKKHIQKEEEAEEIKPTEVLLEKVLRYFQQGGSSQNEMDANSIKNLFVPKQSKLEEQPSFIPLNDTESPAIVYNSK